MALLDFYIFLGTVANVPPNAQGIPPHLDHSYEDEMIGAYGMGNFITAKPNRIVMMKASVWHQINRVDDDAGDHCRCSVVAFFKKEKEESNE